MNAPPLAGLRIVSTGPMTTVQDLGRHGLRRSGVPRAGALHPGWLRLANALAGQPQAASALELMDSSLVVEAEGASLRLALTGPLQAHLRPAGDGAAARRLAAGASLMLHPGERLTVSPPLRGRVGYVAVAGLALPAVLGSASTYVRAGFGGFEGRPLRAGDLLVAAPQPARAPLSRLSGPAPWDAPDDAALRVVPGPQVDHFDEAAHEVWQSASWTVSREADRMGLRLTGPRLVHRPDLGAEIVTDALVPGSVQVPGHGQPIVLAADGHTAGGYPKIATVISADLPRLATAAIGSTWRFVAIDAKAAEAAAREAEAGLQAIIAAIGPAPPRPPDDADGPAIDPERLASASLIDGMVDALDPRVT